MKLRLIAFALLGTVVWTGWTGCSNTAAVDELNDKIEEQTKMLTDTVGFFADSIMGLQAHIDSLEALLAPATSSKSTSSGGKTTTAPAPTNTGKVDVTKKGTSGEQIDVTKKGSYEAGTEKKIDVKRKKGSGTTTGDN